MTRGGCWAHARRKFHDLREQFPALGGDIVFLENAGGSQVPAVVADAMHRYLMTGDHTDPDKGSGEVCQNLVNP
mgnify:CR=1 FL=1